MNILVCIKQVPILEASIELDPKKKWLSDNCSPDYRINRFDEYALEEALRIKSKVPNTLVNVLSVGPSRVLASIQRAMGMGADYGIHIDHPREGLVDPQITASLISQYAINHNYDLIFTGIMAEDDMQCLVGPLLAGYLKIPCAVSVVQTQISMSANMITVKSELDAERHQTIQLSLPALITIQSGINQPRYPSLSNMLRSRKEPVIRINAANLFQSAPKVKLAALNSPPRSGKIEFIQGSMEEKADKLLQIFYKKSLLI